MHPQLAAHVIGMIPSVFQAPCGANKTHYLKHDTKTAGSAQHTCEHA